MRGWRLRLPRINTSQVAWGHSVAPLPPPNHDARKPTVAVLLGNTHHRTHGCAGPRYSDVRGIRRIQCLHRRSLSFFFYGINPERQNQLALKLYF